METIAFHKVHSGGNDFIIIFNEKNFTFSNQLINKLCNRNFGVGGDGIFTINNNNIVHYDPDGSTSFCINGLLCLSYLFKLGFDIKKQIMLNDINISFSSQGNKFSISFKPEKINSEKKVVENITGQYIEIGNPHFFITKNHIDLKLLKKTGNLLVNHVDFPNGANISFITKLGTNNYKIATFERGVNKITNSCGSACAAYSIHLFNKTKTTDYCFIPPSKTALISSYNNNTITITGEVTYVFKGNYSINADNLDISTDCNL